MAYWEFEDVQVFQDGRIVRAGRQQEPPLNPQQRKLLFYLLKHQDRELVTRQELQEFMGWYDPDAPRRLERLVSALRLRFGNEPERDPITVIPGKGYRFRFIAKRIEPSPAVATTT